MSNYHWNAEDYAKHASAQQSWARELIAKLKLHGHENVLDIGCGDGKITAEIAAALPNGSVVGIDSADSMIKLARKAYARNKYPNL
ncbi:MAG: class I SAM-dependent methyltransferase, partial [Nitrospiria bacterium]